MDIVNSALRWCLEFVLAPFAGFHPLVSLVPLAVLTGVAMLWVFAKVSDQKAIRRAKKKMQAYLLELRLFGDDPGLMWSAQMNLIKSNLRYMGLMFKPAIYLTVPMVFLLIHLDAVYGIDPIPTGESAVLTVRVDGRLAAQTSAPNVRAPSLLAVETPVVRGLTDGVFSWRVRAVEAGTGDIEFDWDGRSWSKTVTAGNGLRYVSHAKTASALESVLAPGEKLLQAADIASVEINYPAASIETGSLRLHWLVWFLVVSLVAAYLLKGVFGVAV